ncbi:MAG: hypothetical protein FWC93_05725 [Defluviitaleaceae bacterium]|nr:hypothetical protein [Defluviitaleaceae bacterium]
MFCKKCGHDLTGLQADFCLKCGTKTSPTPAASSPLKKPKQKGVLVAAAIIALVVCFGIFQLLSNDENSALDADTNTNTTIGTDTNQNISNMTWTAVEVGWFFSFGIQPDNSLWA